MSYFGFCLHFFGGVFFEVIYTFLKIHKRKEEYMTRFGLFGAKMVNMFVETKVVFGSR